MIILRIVRDILRGDQSAVLRLSEKDKHTTSESEPRKS